MFGFQRVGDLIRAAADQRSRGFLLGATAGRTTLGGEGLQHQDGSSHMVAATIPTCRACDPAFAGELAVILDHGAREMLEQRGDVFYYITAMNEKCAQPSLPEGGAESVIRGVYRYATASDAASVKVRLLGSGAILREVIAAAELLAEEWQVVAEVWSVTSFSELARDAREIQRWNRLHPGARPRTSFFAECLAGDAPIVAVTDYVSAYPGLIASYVAAPFVALGTDGFGRSDARAALRRLSEVDRQHIVVAALQSLADTREVALESVTAAILRYELDSELGAPWTR